MPTRKKPTEKPSPATPTIRATVTGSPRRCFPRINTRRPSSNSISFQSWNPALRKISCERRSFTGDWDNSSRPKRACRARSSLPRAAWRFFTTKRCYTRTRAATMTRLKYSAMPSPASRARRAATEIPARWRSFTSSWATRTRNSAIFPPRFRHSRKWGSSILIPRSAREC